MTSDNRRLELADYPVTEVRLGRAFRYENPALEVDAGELAALVSQDGRIDGVSFDVVYPGESVRVTGIRDIVEPRVKVAAEARCFPERSARWNMPPRVERTVYPAWPLLRPPPMKEPYGPVWPCSAARCSICGVPARRHHDSAH